MQGSGPALLVLQGGPGLSSRSVALIGELLHDRFRVIRFEHAAPTIRDLLRQMEAVRTELAEEQWFVMGHSWAAAAAAMYAVACPERLQGLILAHPLEICSEFCDLPDYSAPDSDEIAIQDHDLDVAEALWEDLEAGFPDQAGEGYDLRPLACQVAVPALVLLGERDRIDRRSGYLWAELMRAGVALLREGGHWSFHEQPQAFRETVTEFLLANAGRRVAAAV